MMFTLANGNEVEVTLATDSYGLPALKVDGFYVASLTPQGKLMLSGIDVSMVDGLQIGEVEPSGAIDGYIATVIETQYPESV